MEILLGPSNDSLNQLGQLCGRAIRASTELYIASAFLTNWSAQEKLSPYCRKLLFNVGTDFALTRKQACENVLRWLPKKFNSDFLAVPSSTNGCFHPKVVAWRGLDNAYRCII